MTRPGKLTLLSGLYLCQGLPFGFQANGLAIYLRTSGLDLTTISLAGALAAPWMFKALWAPLVDRYWSPALGRRRSWILPTQALLGLTCVAAAYVPAETNLSALLGLVFLMNLFAATQDIAVDGLAVDLLADDELGPGNATQVVGYKVGMLAGGGLLVWATASIGWPGLFLSMAGIVAVVFLRMLFFTEPEVQAAPRSAAGLNDAGVPDEPPTLREVLERVLLALRQPGALSLLLFIATYKLGETMVDVMYRPFLVDSGFEAAQIGLWLGTWGMIASLLGSVAGGVLAARLPLFRAVAIAAAVRVLPVAGEWGLAVYGVSKASVIAVTVAENFFGGVLTTAMFAFMMSRVDRRIGATHYTLFASVEVLGKMPAGMASGPLAERIGYAPLFGLGVLLSIAFLALLPLVATGEAAGDQRERMRAMRADSTP